MAININFKLYVLLLTVFLIFNLACEDSDYPTIFEDESTYTLLLNTTISDNGNYGIYAYGTSSLTLVNSIVFFNDNHELILNRQ